MSGIWRRKGNKETKWNLATTNTKATTNKQTHKQITNNKKNQQIRNLCISIIIPIVRFSRNHKFMADRTVYSIILAQLYFCKGMCYSLFLEQCSSSTRAIELLSNTSTTATLPSIRPTRRLSMVFTWLSMKPRDIGQVMHVTWWGCLLKLPWLAVKQ